MFIARERDFAKHFPIPATQETITNIRLRRIESLSWIKFNFDCEMKNEISIHRAVFFSFDRLSSVSSTRFSISHIPLALGSEIYLHFYFHSGFSSSIDIQIKTDIKLDMMEAPESLKPIQMWISFRWLSSVLALIRFCIPGIWIQIRSVRHRSMLL